MEDPIIDPELSVVLPEMSKAEFEQLEKNIVSDGKVYDPILVWSETNAIVDGHHRWEIIKKHDIPYEIVYMGFPDKTAVKQWMRMNAYGQRNLTEAQEGMLMASYNEDNKHDVGAPYGNQNAKKQSDQNGQIVFNARAETAKKFHVGEGTVQRAVDMKKAVDVAEEISPGFEQKVMSGDIDVPKSTLASIAKVSEEKRPEIVEMIQDAKEKKDVQKIQKEIEDDIRAQRGTDMTAFRRSLREAINGADLLIAKALTGDEMEEQEGCEIAMEELERGIEVLQKHIRFVEGYEK